jgi:CP family cyanate transporter-like MFS transporter
MGTKQKLVLGLPIFLAAMNLRAGINLISPLVPIIKNYFHLNNIEISVLAGIPVLCFAGASLFMGIVNKLGSSERIIKWALFSLFIGLIARATTGLFGLFIFSIIVGLSIAVINYEIPAWIKTHAPNDAGFMTGIYVTLMGVCAGIAVAISVPLAHLNHWSWRLSMLPWILVAGISALFWQVKRSDSVKAPNHVVPFWKSKAFKNPIAWAMAIFFGLQSITFYATATWLPTILTTKDFTLGKGALVISISGVIGSVVGLIIPHHVNKVEDKKIILIAVGLMTAIGFYMLTVQRGSILFLWLAISNIGMSISFPVALMLAGTKSATPEATRNLSTMMQSIGYLIAAVGPTLVGGIHDLSHSWDTAIRAVVIICILQMLTGWFIGKPSTVEH